jgi:hypothetical protein
MARNLTGVKITAFGLDGITVTGITVNYAVGSIPTAFLEFAPGDTKQSLIDSPAVAILNNLEEQKREKDITVNVSVTSYVSKIGYTTRTINFLGVLDGVNIGNTVGNNTYQAVLKNKAQYCRELTVLTPGLHPTSINIYTNPDYVCAVRSGEQDSGAVIAWSKLTEKMSAKGFTLNNATDPIEYYTGLMRLIIKLQQEGWKDVLGRSEAVDSKVPFESVFNSDSYKRALKAAEALFNNVDHSAVSEGMVSKPSGRVEIISTLKNIFVGGPKNLLDNYLYFLDQAGCTAIISNSKLFVVPSNSFLALDSSPPNKHTPQLQSEPNRAGPADYNGYTYSDDGYKDIGHIVLLSSGIWGGVPNNGDSPYENTILITYSHPGAKGSGVLAVTGSPFMASSAALSTPKDSKEFKDSAGGGDVIANVKANFDASVNELKEEFVKRADEKNKAYAGDYAECLKAFAKTKYYQAKYYDRMGSLNMDFNPYWVPGTGGTLYIKETKAFLTFYVTSVTHRIETGAPNNGLAMTTVNFCCGRLGSSSIGVEEDPYLGYNLGKEKNVQKGFVEDI